MAKQWSAKSATSTKKAMKSVKRSLRALERRLDRLEQERRTVGKGLKRLGRQIDTLSGERRSSLPWARGQGPAWARGFGPPPWAKGAVPVVSLEVPLETDDPGAPLWATVSARLPEEITVVSEDGRVVRYRYSPVGSTPQAPSYRRLQQPSEPFPT